MIWTYGNAPPNFRWLTSATALGVGTPTPGLRRGGISIAAAQAVNDPGCTASTVFCLSVL